MNTLPIQSSQNFKGVDYRFVSPADSRFLKNNLKKLEELGKNYEIKLVSTYAGVPNYSAIEIIVEPLKENLKNLKKLLPPKGVSSFKTGFMFRSNTEKTIIDSVMDAIHNLNSKVH